MSEYVAPVEDLRFVINDVAGLGSLSERNETTPELVDQILGEAGRFSGEVLAPLNRQGDIEGSRLENGVVRVPEGFSDAYRNFSEGGWGSVSAPKEWGGQGLPLVISTGLNEIWQSANMGLANCMMLTQGAVELLATHGTEEQKQKYLPKLVSGEWSGTMNLTEPHAGSDVGRLTTRAVPANGGWHLHGSKIFITFGDHDMSENIVHLVLGRLPDAPEGVRGISLFVVPKRKIEPDGTPGEHNDVRVASLEHKLGQMASPTCVLLYGNNSGAEAELVGEPHGGLRAMFTMMNHARLNVGIQGVAIAERAYQQARNYAKERVQGFPIENPGEGAVPIIRHPDVRRMVMDMRARTEAIRALAIVLAGALDRGKGDLEEKDRAEATSLAEVLTPIVKGWCTDEGVAVTSTGIQVHGGMGYIEETGASQHYRDARILPIYEGTNGIQALDLLRRKLPMEDGHAFASFVGTIKATARELVEAGGDDLPVIGGKLQEAAKTLDETGQWLAKTFVDDPRKAAAGATPFLEMAGVTAGSWVMGRAALCASQRLASGEDSPFLTAKIKTARYFADMHLPRTAALAGPVRVAHKTIDLVTEID